MEIFGKLYALASWPLFHIYPRTKIRQAFLDFYVMRVMNQNLNF